MGQQNFALVKWTFEPLKIWIFYQRLCHFVENIPTIFLIPTMNTCVYEITHTMIKFQTMGLQKKLILGEKTKWSILKTFWWQSFYVIEYFHIDINTSKYYHNSEFVKFKEDLITYSGPDSYFWDMTIIANFSFSMP